MTLRQCIGVALLCCLSALATTVEAAPTREVAADSLAAAGKLFCHRTFQATGWTQGDPVQVGFPGAYYENDQDVNDTSLCGFRTAGHTMLYSTIAAPTSGVGLAGRGAMILTGSGGVFNLEAAGGGAVYQQGNLTGRIGWRFYHDYSAADFSCECAKITQVGDYWSFIGCDFTLGLRNGTLGWHGGGEGLIPNLTSGMVLGKWWRLEGYLDTYQNPQTAQLFMTDLATGTEYSRTVTSGMALVAQQLGGFTDFIHMYRDQRIWPGTCVNHFQYALVGKNLGPTERLPISSEIEGGGPPPPNPPPAEPGNPQLSTWHRPISIAARVMPSSGGTIRAFAGIVAVAAPFLLVIVPVALKRRRSRDDETSKR